LVDRDLVQYDRFRPFTVPDRSPSLTVPERIRSFYERFRSFVTYIRRSTGILIRNINGKKKSINAKELHETIKNAQERSETIRNGQKRSKLRNFVICQFGRRNIVLVIKKK
jgi:hypothetical protein